MGCFLACFSSPYKHRKHLRLVDEKSKTPSTKHHGFEAGEALQLAEPIPRKLEVTEEPIKPIVETEEKVEGKQVSCNREKKVTFDLNHKTKLGLSTEEVPDHVVKNNQDEENENKEMPSIETGTVSYVIESNVGFNPPNHRYQNCGVEEYEDLALEAGDLEDDCDVGGGNDQILVQEESSDLFSLSIDSRKHGGGVEFDEKEVSSGPMPKCDSPKVFGSNPNARDNTWCVDPVLNPVESLTLTQWKAVKPNATLLLQSQDKENINVEQDLQVPVGAEPRFSLLNKNSKDNTKNPKDQDLAVDTSLSSWLVKSEATTPESKNGDNSVGNSPNGKRNLPTSHEDSRILRALTIEELKQLSASNSVRRPRRRSSDEIPMIGTIGSYWKHTGQIIDSGSGSSSKGNPNNGRKNAEDETVKLNCTPFQARLDGAMDNGIAQV